MFTHVDLDVKIGLSSEKVLVLDRQESDLVKSIRSVGDKLTKKDLLVAVQRVDNELHHAVDFSLELVLLRLVTECLGLAHTHAIQLDGLLLTSHAAGIGARGRGRSIDLGGRRVNGCRVVFIIVRGINSPSFNVRRNRQKLRRTSTQPRL